MIWTSVAPACMKLLGGGEQAAGVLFNGRERKQQRARHVVYVGMIGKHASASYHRVWEGSVM